MLQTTGGRALGAVAAVLGEPRKAVGLLGCRAQTCGGALERLEGCIAGETEASIKAGHII